MKRSREIADLLTPWAGLMASFTALAIAHQYGTDGVFDDCLAVSPLRLTIVSLLMICATAAGALVSWQVIRNEREAATRKMIALISVGASALFALAMILPAVAALMIPPCFE